MAITVDTVQLRFKIKPDYDQQQIQQLQTDIKQSQKAIEAERKEMDKYAKTLNETRVKLREAIEERDKLAKLPRVRSNRCKAHNAHPTDVASILQYAFLPH